MHKVNLYFSTLINSSTLHVNSKLFKPVKTDNVACRKMLTHAKKLAAKNQSQSPRSPFYIVWPSGAARLVNFTVQRVVYHHETSLKLKLKLKKL